MLTLNVNGAQRQARSAPDTPLLWVLRDELNLTGTKFGCGVALCGACTVHVNGVAVRACVTPAGTLAGKKVRTIEGMEDAASGKLSALQEAWVSHQVPQCGYCQSGMLMAAAALLANNPAPSDADIDKEITNICRCGTYQRIRAAIHTAARSDAPKLLVGAADSQTPPAVGVVPAASPAPVAAATAPAAVTGTTPAAAPAGGAK